MLFPTAPCAMGFPDKGYLRMIESLLNVQKHTMLMHLRDPTPFSRLYSEDVLDQPGQGALTFGEDNVTHRSPGLFMTLKVTFCSSPSFITTRVSLFVFAISVWFPN